jgi:hypothetical protein
MRLQNKDAEFDKAAGDEALGILKSLPNVIPGVAELRQYPQMIQDYESYRQQGKGMNEAASAAMDAHQKRNDVLKGLQQRFKEFSTNPDAATGRAIVDAIPWIIGGAFGGAEVAPEEAGLSSTMEAAAPEVPKPGIVKQIIKGKNVNQPGAQAAVRGGVQASTEAAETADESLAANIKNQPLVKGPNTVLDEHMSALQDNETAAYKKMDDAAGFDVKAEKQQLVNDHYKLKQLGNTDADVTARGNLIESINDSTDRIAQAEAKMKAAGIDPKAADAIHQQRMAGTDFKKSLVKNTNPADGSVNVDGLLNDAKKLRFTKYGDRLQQFMGKEGADNYVSQLEEMQKLGAHAVKARWVAGITATVLGLGKAGLAIKAAEAAAPIVIP